MSRKKKNNHFIVPDSSCESAPFQSKSMGNSSYPKISTHRRRALAIKKNLKKAVKLPLKNFKSSNVRSAAYVKFTVYKKTNLATWGLIRAQCYSSEVVQVKQKTGGDYEVLMLIEPDGVDEFNKKINEYLSSFNDKGGTYTNKTIIQPITKIESVPLRALSKTPLDVSKKRQFKWWEVWVFSDKKNNFIEACNERNIKPSSNIDFVERSLFIIKAKYIDLDEIFRETDYITSISDKVASPSLFFDNVSDGGFSNFDKKKYVEDVLKRTTYEDSCVDVVLLDDGVCEEHPLLKPYIKSKHLDAVSSWSAPASCEHGTPMAGLALFNDLFLHLESTRPINVNHKIQGVRIINNNEPAKPQFWGEVTVRGAEKALENSRNKVFCSAVTDDSNICTGHPDSWSSEIDRFTHDDKQLFLQAIGNKSNLISLPKDVVKKHERFMGESPSQAWNTLTIGAVTYKESPGYKNEIFSEPGELSPYTKTSSGWMDWPIKPEVVFEGGNAIIDEHQCIIEHSDVSLLSTAKSFSISMFTPFCATSASTAIASNFASTLWGKNERLWPETIKGLMVHSADWTEQMNEEMKGLLKEDSRTALRKFGWGVPSMEKAIYSTNNSLTLIAERD